jgi:hypothetical protein
MHYYFHVHNGFGVARDAEGSEHIDVEHARRHAAAGIRSMLSAEVLDGRLDLRGHVEIADENHCAVEVVKFADVLHLLTGELPRDNTR